MRTYRPCTLVWYVPASLFSIWYYPVFYFPTSLHPLTFHPEVGGPFHPWKDALSWKVYSSCLWIYGLRKPSVSVFSRYTLTLKMVSHKQQPSTNPWIIWAFSLTQPNPGYDQSQPRELHQPMDRFGIWPNLTAPFIWLVIIKRTPPTHWLVGHLAWPNLTLSGSHNQENSTNPWIGLAFNLT